MTYTYQRFIFSIIFLFVLNKLEARNLELPIIEPCPGCGVIDPPLPTPFPIGDYHVWDIKFDEPDPISLPPREKIHFKFKFRTNDSVWVYTRLYAMDYNYAVPTWKTNAFPPTEEDSASFGITSFWAAKSDSIHIYFINSGGDTVYHFYHPYESIFAVDSLFNFKAYKLAPGLKTSMPPGIVDLLVGDTLEVEFDYIKSALGNVNFELVPYGRNIGDPSTTVFELPDYEILFDQENSSEYRGTVSAKLVVNEPGRLSNIDIRMKKADDSEVLRQKNFFANFRFQPNPSFISPLLLKKQNQTWRPKTGVQILFPSYDQRNNYLDLKGRIQ